MDHRVCAAHHSRRASCADPMRQQCVRPWFRPEDSAYSFGLGSMHVAIEPPDMGRSSTRAHVVVPVGNVTVTILHCSATVENSSAWLLVASGLMNCFSTHWTELSFNDARWNASSGHNLVLSWPDGKGAAPCTNGSGGMPPRKLTRCCSVCKRFPGFGACSYPCHTSSVALQCQFVSLYAAQNGFLALGAVSNPVRAARRRSGRIL